MTSVEWERYDPSWLVRLKEVQEPSRPWLARALQACTKCRWESRAYVHFVNPSNANKPGAEWQLRENIVLDDPAEGELVLDILKDGRVGGLGLLWWASLIWAGHSNARLPARSVAMCGRCVGTSVVSRAVGSVPCAKRLDTRVAPVWADEHVAGARVVGNLTHSSRSRGVW